MDGADNAGPVLAIDHDRLFKELLWAFFLEFLELFFPKIAEMIERDSIEFLSQELYTDILEGDKFLADIIVKVRFKAETLFSWFISNTKAPRLPISPSAISATIWRF